MTASSAVSSVTGKPFSAGSVLGFFVLSAAAGEAAARSGGKSMPNEKTQAKATKAARQDLGVS